MLCVNSVLFGAVLAGCSEVVDYVADGCSVDCYALPPQAVNIKPTKHSTTTRYNIIFCSFIGVAK
jgi:hypothetical protein